jgi:hypothetical protein
MQYYWPRLYYTLNQTSSSLKAELDDFAIDYSYYRKLL